jgi:hypothetical protein
MLGGLLGVVSDARKRDHASMSSTPTSPPMSRRACSTAGGFPTATTSRLTRVPSPISPVGCARSAAAKSCDARFGGRVPAAGPGCAAARWVAAALAGPDAGGLRRHRGRLACHGRPSYAHRCRLLRRGRPQRGAAPGELQTRARRTGRTSPVASSSRATSPAPSYRHAAGGGLTRAQDAARHGAEDGARELLDLTQRHDFWPPSRTRGQKRTSSDIVSGPQERGPRAVEAESYRKIRAR